MVPGRPIAALVHVMAWCHIGPKPMPELTLVVDACATLCQCVHTDAMQLEDMRDAFTRHECSVRLRELKCPL